MTMKQSFAWWCFGASEADPRALLRSARKIGYQGVELLPRALWPTAAEEGLAIVTESLGEISQGLNRLENHTRIEDELHSRLEMAVKYGLLNFIVFSGNRDGLADEKGIENTIIGLRRLAPVAQSHKITLILELLNSKVDHLDYQCDHTDWAVKVVSQVNSDIVKILYDIYHMQIMEGDIIRTVNAITPFIGHIHTAGNPGRHDFDSDQELNYPPIIKSLGANHYSGFIGQEFVPKGEVVVALEKAYTLCNI